MYGLGAFNFGLSGSPPAGSNGTVTSFSFVDANGFTGSVTNPTTTPALTLSISDARITGALLTGLVAGANTSIVATDTILVAFQNLQAQITAGAGGVIGSGTNNFLPKWTGTTTLGNSLFQDNGVATSSGGTPLADVRFSVIGIGTSSLSYTAQFHNSTGNSNSLIIGDNASVGIGTIPSNGVLFDILNGDPDLNPTATNIYTTGISASGSVTALSIINDTTGSAQNTGIFLNISGSPSNMAFQVSVVGNNATDDINRGYSATVSGNNSTNTGLSIEISGSTSTNINTGALFTFGSATAAGCENIGIKIDMSAISSDPTKYAFISNGDACSGFNILTPSAFLHAGAGTATIPPFKLTPGTNSTTAQEGAIEYDGINLFFTRTGTTREGVLTQSAVTTEIVVSDTTVTVNIGGTTYKLLARA